MRNKGLILWAAVLILCLSTVLGRPGLAKGVSLIRDTEIENTIRVYTAPLFNVAGLDPSFVRIHLVQDPRLNAFVAGGQRIFLNTGLLTRADGPGQVIGVLAHEIGHITGGHLARMQDAIRNAQATSIAALILGIPAAVLSGEPGAVAAASSAGQSVAVRSFLAYTRTMERAADQAAVTFMNDAGLSSKGLLEFLKILEKNSRLYASNLDPYLQSHPLTEDRITFMEEQVAISPYTNVRTSDQLMDMHQRMRAKLIGYLEPMQQVLARYPENDPSTYSRYARSIANMRISKTERALELADSLLAEAPRDPFYWELRGDILKDAARLAEAIDAYEEAVEILPWAALIRVALAQSQLAMNDDRLLPAATENLEEALRYEPWQSNAWRSLGIAYGRAGFHGQASLALAEEAARRGKGDVAIQRATKAMELLPNGSAEWMQAQDIKFLMERLKKEAEARR